MSEGRRQSGKRTSRAAGGRPDELPNLGPASRAMLRDAGIETLAALRGLGSVRAYARVKSLGGNASLNLLWALEAALTGLDWRQVARDHRTSLLLALDAIEGADAAPGAQNRLDSARVRRGT